MNSFSIIISGVLQNIWLTVLSCIIPILVGVVVTYASKNNVALAKPIKLFGYIFESFSPIVLIVVLFYCLFAGGNRFLICVISFSIAFMGYIPSRLVQERSLVKDIAVNSVDLLSHAFKWSFCTRVIALMELLGSMTRVIQSSNQTGVVWLGLIISFAIVLLLKAVQFILEEKLN